MNTTPHDHGGTMPDEVFIVAAHNAITSVGWEITHISKSGIIAAVAPGEEIKIVKNDQGINISVKGGYSQSAQQNITALKLALDHALKTLHPETIDGQYAHLSQSFKNDSALKEKQPDDWASLLIPSKKFFFTPLIIYANVLVFILMVVKGMDFFSPDTQMIAEWGGNFKPYTLNGEWWRMITACFLHFGILHLALNMYALLYIGIMLEPLVGKWRYVTAYLLTGIASSALSLYWNDPIVSAGASGAVFGMYGMFIAMLVGGIVNKSLQKELLASMAGFVIINLSFGFAASGIDNAGHIGGLVSGILIGFVMVPGLKKPNIALNLVGYVGALIIGLGSGWFAYNYGADDLTKYQQLESQYGENEQASIKVLGNIKSTEDTYIAKVIRDSVLPYWHKNRTIIKQLEMLDLPEPTKKRSLLLKQYTNARIENYELLLKLTKENTVQNNLALEKSNAKIKSLLDKLNTKQSEEKP